SSFGTEFIYRRLAKRGDSAVGLPSNVTLDDIDYPLRFSGDGGVVVASSLSIDGVDTPNTSALIVANTSGIKLIARQGDQPPGMSSGNTFGSFLISDGFPAIPLSTSGPISFLGRISGQDNSWPLWSATNAGIQPLAVTGGQVPGQAPGVTFNGVGGDGAEFYGSGGTVFLGGVTGLNGSSDTVSGIWVGDASGMQLVTSFCASAPGADGAIKFYRFNKLIPNDFGQVVFRAHARDDAHTQFASGVWTGAPGSLHAAALAGQQAAELPASVVFRAYDDGLINPPMPAINSL